VVGAAEIKIKINVSRTKFESAQRDAPEFIPDCGVVGASGGCCSMMEVGLVAGSKGFYGVRRHRSGVKLGTKRINIYVF